ncbi:MAG: hypothetical protein AAGB48_06560 [Planctomycetota bacterium]
MIHRKRTGWLALAALAITGHVSGCVSNRLYNATPEEYLVEVQVASDEAVGVDLAVIEFDDFGMLWLPDQLEDAVDLIARRNADSERGIIVVTYTHGWQNNANADREQNDLARFRAGMRELARDLRAEGGPAPDHVIGVYLGWRGATNRVVGWKSLTFWNRKDAAERVASYQMRETLFRITAATKARADSKVLLSGHSMGGMILARTLAPTLSTLLLASGPEGVFAPSDMVVIQNPALDGLAAFQFIEYLKRTGATAELRYPDGRREPAPGPVIVSITSEADWVTRVAYPAGQIYDNLPRAFRDDLGEGLPSQGRFSNRAHGHLDFLISHRAEVVDGRVVLEAVPGAYNDTPFWIVQTTAEICKDHGDIYNERFLELVEQITKLNRLYESGVETWIRQDHSMLHSPDTP